jgi:hypothetical protein
MHMTKNPWRWHKPLFWSYFLGSPIALVVIASVVEQLLNNKAASAFVIFFSLFLVYLTYTVFSFPCPRCRNCFYWGESFGPFTSSCMNCKLEKGRVDWMDDTRPGG